MQATSRRGRPQEADPRLVSRVALQLFEERGFDQVTMNQIAEAASVSRRTLFRLFPSKSDLVWEGLQDIRDALEVHAASLRKEGLPLRVLLDELFVPVLRTLDEPEAAELARRRLRLIAGAPALLYQKTLLQIEEVLATTLETAGLPDDLPPSLVARSLVAGALAALLWWAERGEGMTALDAARGGMKAMALAGEGLP
ncbi:MAG: TetR family transcriptional regulator [Polyangiaceae bacterium]